MVSVMSDPQPEAPRRSPRDFRQPATGPIGSKAELISLLGHAATGGSLGEAVTRINVSNPNTWTDGGDRYPV